MALTPEEKVRQWFIGVLKERLKVPEYMMMSEVGMKFGGRISAPTSSSMGGTRLRLWSSSASGRMSR